MNRLKTPVRASKGSGPARCLLLLSSLLSALLVAPAARAADLTPAQKLEMKQLYEKATRAYDVGKYNEAIEDYQKAYEIGGDPPMLYNIAQAYRLNDQPAEAVRFYRRYLQRAPNARNREDVERKIADLEKTIEDRRKAAAAATPPPLPAPPVVPATPPAATPVAPTPVGPPAPTAPALGVTSPGAGTTEPPVGAADESGHTLRVVGWSLVGGGVLFGAGALVTGLMARSKGQDVTNMSNSDQMFDPNVEHSGILLNHVTIGLGVTGGALAVAGAILVVVGSSGSSGGSGGESAPAQESAPPPATTPPAAMVAPWLGNGLVGAGAAFRF
jgi:hypothetical protein